MNFEQMSRSLRSFLFIVSRPLPRESLGKVEAMGEANWAADCCPITSRLPASLLQASSGTNGPSQ